MSSKQWLSQLLNVYLSIEHVNGKVPCPLAFLATDIVARNKVAQQTYSNTYQHMNRVLMNYAGTDTPCNKTQMLSLTSMIIGAVAISRTMDDEELIHSILSACRQQARVMLGGI